jgi:hypothetical protein
MVEQMTTEQFYARVEQMRREIKAGKWNVHCEFKGKIVNAVRSINGSCIWYVNRCKSSYIKILGL